MTWLLAAGLVLGGVAAVLSARSGGDPPPLPSRDLPASRLAAESCVRLRLVQQGIVAGSAADTVRTELADARTLAAEAAGKDSAYVALSGGAAALDEALKRDDPGAAAIAVRVVRASCASRSVTPRAASP